MWMLVIAIPGQGMASVTMVSCGLGHHHSAQTAASRQDVENMHAHPHPADAMQAGHGHAQADEGRAGSGSDIDHAKTNHHVKQKCSVCTTCCVAAVLPSVSVALREPLLADFFHAHAPRGVSSILIDSLERPPRTVLA
ncbi:MAG: hypothetical protein K2Q07_08870 [Burkholderiaceae bacterium]|nr:hypothetical protein [Burkholderiaceae bacterium]